MRVDKELIEKVAKNARLKLSDSEIKSLLPEIKEILDLFSEIDKANVSNLKPSFQPLEIKNVTRKDEVFKFGKKLIEGYLKVKSIIKLPFTEAQMKKRI